MSRKHVLYLVFFGVLELGLTTFFSLFIWLSLLDSDFYLPSLINLLLLGITFCYGIGQFFYRTKAKAYLYGLVLRIFFIGSVFIICQIGFIGLEVNYVWLTISVFVYICTMIYWVIKEKKAWNLTLEVLEKSGKLNVKKKYFRILGGFNSATDKPRNPNVKGTLVGFIIAIGFGGFKLLQWYLAEEFILILLRVGFVFMSNLTGLLFGKILLWTIEIRKLEKKLGIEFVTEFGEISNSKKSDGKKNRIKLSQNK